MKNQSTSKWKLILLLAIGLLAIDAKAQHPSSIIDLESTSKGMLAPRMNTAERIALPGINAPAAGLLVYDTETMTFWYWDNMEWNEIASGLANDYSSTIANNMRTLMDSISISLPDVVDTIVLAGPGNITADTRIEVCLNVTHTYNDDLEISLTAPDGSTTIDLMSDIGGNGDNLTGTCFSNQASINISTYNSDASSAPLTGLYLPEGSFDDFIGQPIAGNWILTVNDDATGDEGNLEGWLINIGSGAPSGSNLLTDSDSDTKVEVERILDEDAIHFVVAGDQAMKINSAGNVAIGPNFAAGYRFSVDGKIATEEVLVNLDGDWPDYVFNSNYKLRSLPQLEAYIAQYGHLPNVPSADQIKTNGLTLGESNRVLMEKIEELTLYLIEADKKNAELEDRVQALESRRKRRFRK